MSDLVKEYFHDVKKGGSPYRCCGRTGYCGLGKAGWQYSGQLPTCNRCPQLGKSLPKELTTQKVLENVNNKN